MRMHLAAWISGVLMVQCLPALPSSAVLSALAVSGVVLWRSPRSRLWAMVVWGVAWSAWRGAEELAARLPLALEGATLRVVGEVADFPTLQPGMASFVLRDVAGCKVGKSATSPTTCKVAPSSANGKRAASSSAPRHALHATPHTTMAHRRDRGLRHSTTPLTASALSTAGDGSAGRHWTISTPLIQAAKCMRIEGHP